MARNRYSRPDRNRGSRQTRAPGRDRLVSGRLDLHRDGFGFVRPSESAQNAPKHRLNDIEMQLTTGDIFVPPGQLNGAMHGDLVLVNESLPGRDGRRSGSIARVLTRRNPTVVGIFHYANSHRPDSIGIKSNYVVPFDERLSAAIHIPSGSETAPDSAHQPHRMLGEEARKSLQVNSLEGMAVDVEITDFPAPGRPAKGRILEILGKPDAFGVDVEIIIRKHHIPHAFPPAVLAEAEEQARTGITAEVLENREDFRALTIITIDGETARDFDDAVLVRAMPNGNNELQVHIADVSHYVLPGSPLDTEARVRGNSVYFPDRAVPMLPHALSSGICSLLASEDRLVLSCIMEVDPQGEIVDYRLAEGVIHSARRMTYTSVQQCLNASVVSSQSMSLNAFKAHSESPQNASPQDIHLEERTERERVEREAPGLPAALDRMLDVARRLNAKRVRRGSIDFDLPEPVVEFDPDGNMKAIVRSERGWAHRLIEEFMLSANECVAHWLEGRGLNRSGIASIYRIHETPDPKRIVEFEELAAGFGHSLGLGSLPVKKFTMKAERRESRGRGARGGDARRPQSHEVPESLPVTPQMYQRLVRRIEGRPEERILAYLMLRSLKQAKYAEQNEGHFALASPSYTHFTSPIRRYPDLIVHRLVRAMLRAGTDPRGGAIRSDDWQPWGERQGIGNREKGIGSRGNAEGPMAAEELRDIAVESSQAERRAADAERELIEWKKVRFMEDKVGDDFPAVILSCTKYGFFVELEEMFIEGLVPLGSLVGDHYSFRDTDRTIVGARTGHVFGIGQKVHVLLDRIDRQQRRLQFALLPGTEPQANTGAASLRGGKSEAKKAKAREKKAGGKGKRGKRKRR